MFQSTFPRGERQRQICASRGTTSFNPRSREGNDAAVSCCRKGVGVSIHVPARGTTAVRRMLGKLKEVSIHVPARGTTASTPGIGYRYLKVSIHVPARGTTDRARKRKYQKIVSIHVPARGTTVSRSLAIEPTVFQSTFPRGERQAISRSNTCYQVFQSTFPRGERRCINIPERQESCFNPRSREGNDLLGFFGVDGPDIVSIHVPARGTTYANDQTAELSVSFNPRSREGNDSKYRERSRSTAQFQSTFPRGERHTLQI